MGDGTFSDNRENRLTLLMTVQDPTLLRFVMSMTQAPLCH
jgi:hypothetical protein